MKTNKTNINGWEEEVVEDYFYMCLDASIEAVMDSFEYLEWYEDCSFSDYFRELEEIWDENEKVGNGFNLTSFSLIVTDDNREELENIFENVRERVFSEYLEIFSNNAWSEHSEYTPYEKEDPRSYDFDKWCEDGEMNSVFLDENTGLKIYKLWSNSLKNEAINVYYDEDGLLHRY